MALQEGAQAGDSLADDERLHFSRALIGVAVLRQSAKKRPTCSRQRCRFRRHLSRPGDCLAHLAVQNAFASDAWASVSLPSACHLGRTGDHALRSRNVSEHLSEEILHELKRADRLSELLALLRVLEGMLVGPHPASRRLPADEIARSCARPWRCLGTSCRPGDGFPRPPAVIQRDHDRSGPLCSAILF